jgi:hypothetical protein
MIHSHYLTQKFNDERVGKRNRKVTSLLLIPQIETRFLVGKHTKVTAERTQFP